MKFLIRCWLITIFLASPTLAYAGDCVSYGRPIYRPPVVVAPYCPPVVKVVPVVAVFKEIVIPQFSAVYSPPIVAYGSSGYGAGVQGVPAGMPQQGVDPGTGVQSDVSIPAPGQPVQAQAPAQDSVLDYLRALSARLDRLEAGTSGAQAAPSNPFDFGGPAPTVRTPAQFQQPQFPRTPQMSPAQARVSNASRDLVMVNRCASCHDSSTAGARGGGVTLTNGGRVVPLSGALERSVTEEVRSGRMPRGRPLSDTEKRPFLAGGLAQR